MATPAQPGSVTVLTMGATGSAVKGFWCGFCGAHASTQDVNAVFSHTCPAVLREPPKES